MSTQRNASMKNKINLFVLALAAIVGIIAPGSSAAALDSAPWDRVLQAHVHRGSVDYAALKADETAMADLNAFLESVARMPESENLAAWLNAYNAIVVKSVIDRYPLSSVRNDAGFFNQNRHRVAGAQRTLDAIENQIIRPRFEDARVHFALNCGARSCPALHGRAFRQGNLDATLDRLARRAVANRRHVRIADGQAEVSEIFHWFSSDFERDAGSVIAWLGRYGANVEGITELGRLNYNWRLNDRSR